VNDFLSGKAPLNLTMRLGDHMMLIQLMLSTFSNQSHANSSSSSSSSSSTSSNNTTATSGPSTSRSKTSEEVSKSIPLDVAAAAFLPENQHRRQIENLPKSRPCFSHPANISTRLEKILSSTSSSSASVPRQRTALVSRANVQKQQQQQPAGNRP
ncbi:hypothetical protein U1Q18_046668, partial [Sarracenia purpurea var. burkii]